MLVLCSLLNINRAPKSHDDIQHHNERFGLNSFIQEWYMVGVAALYFTQQQRVVDVPGSTSAWSHVGSTLSKVIQPDMINSLLHHRPNDFV